MLYFVCKIKCCKNVILAHCLKYVYFSIIYAIYMFVIQL